MTNISFFKQKLNIIPTNIIQKAVKTHDIDNCSKGLTTYVQMLSMKFCQLSKFNSIREIVYGLKSTLGNWNHLGIKNIIPKWTNLAYNNQMREHVVFREISWIHR